MFKGRHFDRWRECIGPRLGALHAPIGSGSGGRLGYVCHMWFDVWPTFRKVRHLPPWQDALCHVFAEMLSVPCREVQVAALHGIGHHVRYLARREMMDERISAFIRSLGERDEELRKLR